MDFLFQRGVPACARAFYVENWRLNGQKKYQIRQQMYQVRGFYEKYIYI